MNQFSLVQLLDGAEKRMTADLRERLVAHPGEAGAGRERVVREFLLSYLPKRFEISTGFAFDSSGLVSKQLDVIIAHSLVCPRFETVGGIRYYPCESVVAVGQVRSSITSRKELLDALENLESAKALDRSAKGKALDLTHQERLDHEQNHLHQMFTFLMITGKSLKGNAVRAELLEYVQTREPHLWPNVIFALDQFIVTYCCDDGVCPNAMHARGISLQPIGDTPGLLMRFYLLLGGAIEVVRVSGLPYWEYLHHAKQWSADVWYSTRDDPPPFLSSL